MQPEQHKKNRDELNAFAKKYCMGIQWFSEYHCRLEDKLNVWTTGKYMFEGAHTVGRYGKVEDLVAILEY